MTQAHELLCRVLKVFEENGIDMDDKAFINGVRRGRSGRLEDGERTFLVEETYGHNGAAENTTVTIKVTQLEGVCLTPICKLKVPKNASDKVIRNRVEKALESYRA